MSGRALQRHRRACALVVLLSALSALGVEPRAAAAQDHGTAELSPSPVFVVGDRSARAGETVTFHADSWAERNSLSSGAAPAAFKGFAGDLETRSGSFTVVNRGEVEHNLTLRGTSVDLAPGDTTVITLLAGAEGTVATHCRLHRDRGMRGRLRFAG